MIDFKFEVDSKIVEDDEGSAGERIDKFIRSKKSSPRFSSIQVENLPSIITEDCVNWIDSDSIAYKMAAAVEEDYVEVKKLTEEDKDIQFCLPDIQEFKNKTQFKGSLRKAGGISADSVLGCINIEREAHGIPSYSLEDFTITPKKRPIKGKNFNQDGKVFDSPEELMYYYIDKWISAIKAQTQVDNIMCVLGEGKCHRNSLLLPKEYKSNRDSLLRPILLKEAREYILDNYPSMMAPKGLEADEVVDAQGFNGYLTYRKSGKFDRIKSSIDKDAQATPGLLFNYSKAYHFTYPMPWLIHASNKDIGVMELVKGDCKATGLLQTACQLVLKDSADYYGSRLNMPASMKPEKSYGDAAFYKDFVNLKTPKEVLQKVVDKFYDFFPTGVRYTAWEGTRINEDTLWWLQQCFSCQYMLRRENDKTKIINLLDAFKVDYSKLVGNNLNLDKIDNTPKKIEELDDNTPLTTLAKTLSITGTKKELQERLTIIKKAILARESVQV